MRLLLLSNSQNHGAGYLEHARDPLAEIIPRGGTVAFIPYAAVTFGYEEYAARVGEALAHTNCLVESVHQAESPLDLIGRADAIAVGGGNTFRLLLELQQADLLRHIRKRALDGVPYIGWSAGSNLACPTIRTTNDMPITEPASFSALDLVPFQINPHYLDAHRSRHQGETREQRILEFITINRHVRVVGLREGSILRLQGDTLQLLGDQPFRLFQAGSEPREVGPEESLSFLMEHA